MVDAKNQNIVDKIEFDELKKELESLKTFNEKLVDVKKLVEVKNENIAEKESKV